MRHLIKRGRDAAHVFRLQRHEVGVLGAIGERIYSVLVRAPSWVADRSPSPDESMTVDPDVSAADPIDVARRAEESVRIAQEAVELSRGAVVVAAEAKDLGDAGRQAITRLLTSAMAEVGDAPLVSVVLASGFPERTPWLAHAVRSVLRQSYPHLELLIVDDAGEAFVERFLAQNGLKDPRIRVLRGDRAGGASARHLAVAHARGTVVAHLDDDCAYYPWWLHSAVAELNRRPDIDYVYGSRVVDWPDRTEVVSRPFDALLLQRYNFIDTNTIVHRSLPGLQWPAGSLACTDWQAVLGSIEAGLEDRWLHVPVPAALYSVDAPGRVWSGTIAPDKAAVAVACVERARVARPVRVLAFNSLFPLSSETYIADELAALQYGGATVAMARTIPTSRPPEKRGSAPLYESLDEAVERLRPDVVLCHWAGWALEARDRIVANGVPFAVRSHSFDQPDIQAALDDPWCVGVWGFGHERITGPRWHCLPVLVDGPVHETTPQPTVGPEHREPSLIVASACLPKRGIDTFFFEAVRRLDPGVSVRVMLAGTDHYRDLLQRFRDAAPDSVEIADEVPYSEVQAQLRSSSVLVYLAEAGVLIGQPRSIVEGALAGCALVVPDDPAIDFLLGDGGHRYCAGDPSSLLRSIQDALDRPEPWTVRIERAARMSHHHHARTHARRFVDELTNAVLDWRAGRSDEPDRAIARWWEGAASR